MIKKGDKYKDCSTEITYRVDNVEEDLITLTLLNGIDARTIKVKPQVLPVQDLIPKDKPLDPRKVYFR